MPEDSRYDHNSRCARNERDISNLQSRDEKHFEGMNKLGMSSIRNENKTDIANTSLKLLTKEVEKVSENVKEINDRPLETYKKLKNGLIGLAFSLLLFTITNAVMFIWSLYKKGIIQ